MERIWKCKELKGWSIKNTSPLYFIHKPRIFSYNTSNTYLSCVLWCFLTGFRETIGVLVENKKIRRNKND